MCGPSIQQKGLASAESQFSTMLSQNYAKNFGAQSQILQNLTNMFTPIASQGPDQQGFGPQELAALQTQSGEGVGTNYNKASVALNNQLAAQGGGNEFLPTGARAALKGNLASAASNELSQEQLGITRANYAQGRQNWSQATAGLNALAGEYDPNAIAGESNSANSSAFGEATKVQEMQNEKEQAIAGGITSLAMGAASFGAGGMGNLDETGSSSMGEQFGNFFKGGISALGGSS